MKHLYLLTLLAALVCGSGILRAEPLMEPADTVNHYVIDNQSIRNFDGSQLIGKKIVSYQVTTVVTHQNIGELDALYEIFDKMDIDSWRVIGIEPMGRAKDYPELLLTAEDHKYILEFIRNKRIAGEPVSYGCSHYLGNEYEREVRDWYFLCISGIYTASITANGDIIGCLDIERRPETIQGNILKDRFKDVWENRFEFFRRDLSDLNEKCRDCSEKDFCHGDSFHSWDFDKNEPLLCFKDILF